MDTMHERLMKRLKICPSHCPTDQRAMKRDAMSMDMHTSMASPPPPHPAPQTCLALCSQVPKAQGPGRKRARHGREPPTPPPSQRLLAYMDSGLIRSTKTNALRRNSEDHQHSSSIKRPCILPQNGKVAELEIINAAFCEPNQKHPSIFNSTTPLRIEPFPMLHPISLR